MAIEAFEQPKVVILGGSDKGVSFDELANTIAVQNVRQVILVGETAPKIERVTRSAGVNAITPGGTTMPEMVTTAHSAAQPGDVVLLSPACASFDLFPNYKERGNQFKTAVNDLPVQTSNHPFELCHDGLFGLNDNGTTGSHAVYGAFDPVIMRTAEDDNVGATSGEYF